MERTLVRLVSSFAALSLWAALSEVECFTAVGSNQTWQHLTVHALCMLRSHTNYVLIRNNIIIMLLYRILVIRSSNHILICTKYKV